MSNARNDGGAAFPVPETYSRQGQLLMDCEPGMTLRDYFAGQALTGILTWCAKPARLSELAYEIADAMIEHRDALDAEEPTP